MFLKIPKEKLPKDESDRYDYLHSYFIDHNIDSIKGDESFWRLSLSKQLFDHCENLSSGLNWLGIKPRDCPKYFDVGDNFIFCLSEALIPYGWSKLYQNNSSLKEKDVVLLHLDSHRDMMNTRLCVNANGSWLDLMNNEGVDFCSPKTILSAINSGAIGIGSMITPLKHYLPKLMISHYNPSVTCEKNYTTNPSYTNDSLLHNDAKLLSTSFVTSINNVNYVETNSFESSVDLCKGYECVLLHIDMDSFNNKYNGDSDWVSNNNYDPDIDEQFKKIDEFTSLLSSTKTVEKVVHTSIGLSPSFYPAKYWQVGIKYLLLRLIEIGIDLQELKNKLYADEYSKICNSFPSPVYLKEMKIRVKSKSGRRKHYWHIIKLGLKIGKIEIDYDDENASINIHLNKSHQGMGYGAIALYLACRSSSHDVIYASMRKSNIASMRATLKSGFIEIPNDAKYSQRRMVWIR